MLGDDKDVSRYPAMSYSREFESTIFNRDKKTEEARMFMRPVVEAEKSFRRDVINHINLILFDRQDPLMFTFRKELKFYYNHSLFSVKGVVARKCEGTVGTGQSKRRLMVIAESREGRMETDAVVCMETGDLVKLAEMTVRQLMPRDDDEEMYCQD